MGISRFFCLLLIVSLLGCQNLSQVFLDSIWIHNVIIVDPLEGLKINQTVVISAGKISMVKNAEDLTIPTKAKKIDGKGKFLIPGLWDAHVHFAYIEELAPYMFNMFLANGVTSVRDTGGKTAFVKRWKDKSQANRETSPRVMMAGPLLDGMPNVYDGSDAGHPPLSVGLSDEAAVEKMVADLIASDVDLLKAYEMLTPEQFRKVTELGKANGLKVTGHVPLSMDVIGASNAGMNSMEHLRNLELSCASNSDELLAKRKQLLFDGKKDPGGILRSRIHNAQRENAVENYDEQVADKVLATLSKNQTWQIPTITLNTNFATKAFDAPEWRAGFKYLPDSIAKVWKESADQFVQAPVPPFRLKFKDWQMNMIKKIHEHKIDIMAGTDCPIFFLTPGPSRHSELENLNAAGLSPLEVLKTATINPARYFNMEEELGSISENKIADLVLLSANPLDDIRNTRKIEGVIKNGKYYNQTDLEALRKTISN